MTRSSIYLALFALGLSACASSLVDDREVGALVVGTVFGHDGTRVGGATVYVALASASDCVVQEPERSVVADAQGNYAMFLSRRTSPHNVCVRVRASPPPVSAFAADSTTLSPVWLGEDVGPGVRIDLSLPPA
jgi:hypothetical protein